MLIIGYPKKVHHTLHTVLPIYSNGVGSEWPLPYPEEVSTHRDTEKLAFFYDTFKSLHACSYIFITINKLMILICQRFETGGAGNRLTNNYIGDCYEIAWCLV